MLYDKLPDNIMINFPFRPCQVDFLVSVKYEKPRCAMHFFHQNFLNAQGISAQRILFFVNFVTLGVEVGYQ